MVSSLLWELLVQSAVINTEIQQQQEGQQKPICVSVVC